MKNIGLFSLFVPFLLTACSINQSEQSRSGSDNRLQQTQIVMENSETPNSSIPTTQSETPSYDFSQIATHNSKSDCWVVVKGKVYNVTPFVKLHPGGEDKIAKACGIDATNLVTNNHSDLDKVLDVAAEFAIGDL